MTQQQTGLQAGKRCGAKQYIVLALVVACVLAAAGAVSYYGEEINLYLSLGGRRVPVERRLADVFRTGTPSNGAMSAQSACSPPAFQAIHVDNEDIGANHRARCIFPPARSRFLGTDVPADQIVTMRE